jgi:hypothetical protein
MKNSKLFFFSALISIITSCSSGDDQSVSGPTNPGSEVTAITLSADSDFFNNLVPISFVVTDNLGAIQTAQSSIFSDGNPIDSTHLFDTPGSYDITATFNGLTSNTLELIIEDALLSSITLVFNQPEYIIGDLAYYNVRDNFDNNITSQSQISVNGTLINTNPFVFDQGGVYEFVASYQDLTSDPVVIEVQSPSDFSDTSTFETSGAPPNFTKKVLLEDSSGTWCSGCPQGAAAMANVMDSNPNVLGVVFHTGSGGYPDPMEIPETTFWQNYYNVYVFPTIYVDGPDTRWNYNPTVVNNKLAEQASLGLSIDAEIIAGKLDMEVSVGFKTTPNEEIKLMIFLIEGSAFYPDSPQAGVSNGASYLHKHILRDVYTDQLGDVIPATSTAEGGIYKRTITGLDIPSNTTDYGDLKVIAYVRNSYLKTFTNEFGNTFANSPHYDIYNVQQVQVGSSAPFD